MRKRSILELIPLYSLTAGRRRLALERCELVVRDIPSAAALANPIPAAIALQTDAILAMTTWWDAQQDRAQHDDGAVELHRQISRAVTTLVGTAEGMQEYPDPEVAGLAVELLKELFPRGAAGNVKLPYVDQHQQLVVMLERVATAEFALHRAKLGLEPHIAVLNTLNPQNGDKLTRPRVTFEEDRPSKLPP